MKKLFIIILLLLLIGCSKTDQVVIPVVETQVISNEPTATLSVEAQQFKDTIDYYEKQITACASIENGEYLGDDVAQSFLNSLIQDRTLFNNSDFVKTWKWLMDDVEVYCSHTAVEKPSDDRFDLWSFGILNKLFEKADAEYYQYQRQAKLGIENKDMNLILSGFEHRDQAHSYMQEASYYYESLFNLY